MLAYFNFPFTFFSPSEDTSFGSQRSPYVQFLLLLHLFSFVLRRTSLACYLSVFALFVLEETGKLSPI